MSENISVALYIIRMLMVLLILAMLTLGYLKIPALSIT
jgi:competence protein ComGC